MSAEPLTPSVVVDEASMLSLTLTARLLEVLRIAPEELSRERLAEVFAGRTADEWATWAAEHDVPLAPLRSS